MDRKSLLILAGAAVVLFLLSGLVNYIFPPIQVPVTTPGSTTNQTANAQPAQSTGTNLATSTPGAGANPPTAVVSNAALPEVTLTVSNTDLIFHFTSRGGGLKEIALRNTNYLAVVHSPLPAEDERNFATLNSKAPVPILATLGQYAAGGDDFTLSQPSNGMVRAEKTLADGLRVVKDFDIRDCGTNYIFTAKIRLENTSSNILPILRREVVVGTATAIGPLDDPNTLGTIWYNGSKSADIGPGFFANGLIGCVTGKKPPSVFEDGASNVVWAGMHSQYFVLAAVPTQPAPGIVITNVSLPPPDPIGVRTGLRLTLTNNYKGYQTAFVYPATRLDAHQTEEQSFTFYAGPKEYNGLAKIGHSMGNNLDLVMGFSSFLGLFSFCSKFLLLSMNGLHDLGLTYGFCIIAITVIIKLVFWPMTAASTRSQKRQQAIAPQLKVIADKYKDDPLKKHQKTTELLKEHKINPLGSCLPMLISIPVFFGFYSMLRNAIELRGVPFLWAHDMTQPDNFCTIAGFTVNLLPLIMGATQLWQSHLTPPAPGMDPGQQKIMRWMPLLFVGIFYRMSAGLNLYYTVSNLLTIAQTKITKMGPDPAAGKGKPGASAPPKKK